MKAVCSIHGYAYEISAGCTWCVPSPVSSGLIPLRIDISLPDHQAKGKGFSTTITQSDRSDIMLHLRESHAMDAQIRRWDGLLLPSSSRIHASTFMERSFCLTQKYGSWVACYLGPDGEVWKSHITAEVNKNGQWVFSIKEFT